MEPVGQAYSQLIKLLSGESELEEEEATETELKTDGKNIYINMHSKRKINGR